MYVRVHAMTITGKSFQRQIEDFHCEQCGFFVTGNGYTNHCPRCLFSRHVDVSPGDRLERCGGLMEPIVFEAGGEMGKLTHRCVRCGFTGKNKASHEDSFEALLAVARKSVAEL